MLWKSLFLLVALTAAIPAEAAPRRIVSLNMCADQLLIVLANRDQIAALTDLSRDPGMSFYAREAMRFPVSGGSAEEVLALRPDLVVAAPFQHREAIALLERRGVRTIDVGFANGLEAIFANIRSLSRAIGHPARGETLIRRMQADLRRTARDKPGRGRIAADYQRRGFLTGTGTLMDEIMSRTGLVNLASKLHRPSLSRLSLEEMIAARPDFLLMTDTTRSIDDRGTEMLHHPALEKIVPPSRRLHIPHALTVCGGPFYAEAVATLKRRIREADAASGAKINPR